MKNDKVATCIEIVKGLHKCGASVKAMNLRALLASFQYKEKILNAIWETVLSWLDWPCSGLTDEEVLRLRTTMMKVKGDASWFDINNPGNIAF